MFKVNIKEGSLMVIEITRRNQKDTEKIEKEKREIKSFMKSLRREYSPPSGNELGGKE